MYKIETHLHTNYISKCGWMDADETLSRYAAAGYDAICVTDHYNRTCFEYAGIDISAPGDHSAAFLDSVRRMTETAPRYGIRIYAGAELRFDGSENDYLLYGFDGALLADPEQVMSGGLAAFAAKARAAGALIVQAHPFRKNCSPMPPELLDGIEVLNSNPRHDSRNDLARAYAEQHGLLMLGGSDCHRPGDEAQSGILSETLPADSMALAALIRSGRYRIIGLPPR